MKKLLLLCFLLASSICFGQRGSIASAGLKYIKPTTKTFTAGQTVIPSQEYFTGGFAKAAGTPNIGASNLMSWLGIFGNGVNFYNAGTNKLYFKNGASSKISAGGFATQGTTAFVHMFANGVDDMFIIKAGTNNGEGGGINAFQGLPSTGGGVYVLYNVFIDGAQSSGIQINGDGTGKYYDSIVVVDSRVVNVGQEGAYNGATHISPIYAPITYIKYSNFIAWITGRNPLQIEHGILVQVENFTLVRGGLNNVGSQNEAIQWHDNGVGSYLKNGLIDSAKGPPFSIFGNGLLKNIRIRYEASTAGGGASYGFIGDESSSIYGVTSRTSLTDTLVLDGWRFEYYGAGTINEAFQWAEKKIPLKLINCTKTSNITNFYTDARGGGGTNGSPVLVNCTTATALPAPHFINRTRSDPFGFFRVDSSWDYNQGIGAFTPHK